MTESKDSSLFDNLLHSYFIFPRPREEKDVEELVKLVCELSVLCDKSEDVSSRWKFFLLVAFHRRYHPKSPAFKEEQKDHDTITDGSSEGTNEAGGDGERLIYYVTLLSFHRLWHHTNKNGKEQKLMDNLKLAVDSMIQVCFDIGGSRDVNAIAEYLTFETLLRLGHVNTNDQEKDSAPSKFGKMAFMPALKDCLLLDDNSSSALSQTDPFLTSVLSKIAHLLTSDLNLLSSSATSTQNNTEEKDNNTTISPKEKSQTSDYLSTIHVTLPYNGRGKKDGKSWQRCLVNSVAELLIWSKVEQTSTENRFSESLTKLHTLSKGNMMDTDESDSATHECIMQMQTAIRKSRQRLNSEARSRGHMLCSQYLMDSSSLHFRQIRIGKQGDLALLSRLAKKKRDANILKMLVKRNTDPSKAQKAESINALMNDWVDLNKEGIEEDSIEMLERQIQISVVMATVNALKPKVSAAVKDPRAVIIAQTGKFNTMNAVCAILLASAIQSSTSCRLILSGVETDISTEELILESINGVMMSKMDCSDSIKDENGTVEKIILEDLADSQDAIIISDSDIELDEVTLRHISEHDKTVRVHSPSRFEVKEPVEVKLRPDIAEKLKSKSHPIVLSVVLDCTGSMGSEIEGCKKGAIKTIHTFKSLASVSKVNFLGYWDPIGSRGDPDPRSTGYLDPKAEGTVETIQKFVNERLPCTGGGDAPEDVPAAIEKLLSDIDAAEISPESIHFLFIIADAGYRSNEEQRMAKLMGKLRDLNIVVIMCPVRRMCDDFVPKVKGVFYPAGQFIMVANDSDISSIAAIVTESVRASLSQTGTLASITTSIGENFESLVQLSNFQKDLTTLKNVEAMTKEEEAPKSDDDDKMEDASGEVFISSGKFGLSNVDRMYLQASKLPPICHTTVDLNYGDGKSLKEQVAASVASRLLAEKIPVEQLTKFAYPPEIVNLVRETMGGHGRKRTISKT